MGWWWWFGRWGCGAFDPFDGLRAGMPFDPFDPFGPFGPFDRLRAGRSGPGVAVTCQWRG